MLDAVTRPARITVAKSQNTVAAVSTIIANRTPKLWDIRRKLSVLESKRLQGFPDDFVMPVSDAQAYKQLGNSVSVPIIKLIMQDMIDTYEKNIKK